MNKTLNFLRILKSLASLGLMGYVGYKYAKQCGDIDKLKERVDAAVVHCVNVCENVVNMNKLDHECHCENCNCEKAEPETPSETPIAE